MHREHSISKLNSNKDVLTSQVIEVQAENS